MTKLWKNVYFTSFLSSLILIAFIAALASTKWGAPVGAVLLPGALAAALVFPEGVESGAGDIFLILAGVIDIVLLASAIVLFRMLFRRRQLSGS